MRFADGRRRGWFWLHNDITSMGPIIGCQGVATYMVICRHLNDAGESHPGAKLIAEEAGTSVSSVKRALRKLVAQRMLVIEPHYEKGRQTTNRYRTTDPGEWVRVNRGVAPLTRGGSQADHPGVVRVTTEGNPEEGNPGKEKTPPPPSAKKPKAKPKLKLEPQTEAPKKQGPTALPFKVGDPIPEPWRLDAVRIGCQDPGRVFERFCDWWRSEGKRKVDWPATWRNWVGRNHDEGRCPCMLPRSGGPRGGGGQKSSAERAFDLADQFEREGR